MLERMRVPFHFGQMVLARYSAVGGSIAAGGLAFYAFFALAPSVIAMGAIAGLFVSQSEVDDAVQIVIDRSPETLKPLEPALQSLVQLADRGTSSAFTITTVASIIVATYVASRVVYGLRSSLTRIFGAPERIHGLIDRGFSAMVTLAGMLVVVAVLLLLQVVPRVLSDLGLDGFLSLVSVRVVNWIVLAAVAFLICGLVIALLPDIPARIKIRSWGVAFATVWMLGSSAVFGLYTSLSNTVGSAIVVFGAPIVLLLWFYLVFMGMLLGGAVEAQLHKVPDPPRPNPLKLPPWALGIAAKVGLTKSVAQPID